MAQWTNDPAARGMRKDPRYSRRERMADAVIHILGVSAALLACVALATFVRNCTEL